MNVWCIDGSDKSEAIRSLFLATLRTISASGGSLFSCTPDILTKNEELTLLCKAGTGPDTLTNNDLTFVRENVSDTNTMFALPDSNMIIILCQCAGIRRNVQLCALLVVTDSKGSVETLPSWAASIAALCVEFSDDHDKSTSSEEVLPKNSSSVHGMVMTAQKLYNKTKALRRAQDVFLANMSHELRGPLHNIIGTTRLLDDSDNMTPQQRSYLDIIDHCGVQLLNIIGDILDYTKLAAGEMTLTPTNFSPFTMVEESIDVILFKAREKGLDVTHSITKNVPKMLFGDGKRIQQIIVNLLGNAVKFTESGRIRIVLDLQSEGPKGSESPKGSEGPTGSEGLENTHCNLQIIIEDTGIGIPRRHQQTVFKTFSQVDNKLSRTTEGSGLGLAIVKKLVSIMDGTVHLTSRSIEDGYDADKTGTDVHVCLPMEIPVKLNIALNSPTINDTEMKRILKKRLIMLYDQDVDSRTFITGTLMAWGAQVLSCSTTHEVSMHVESNNMHFDLFILDFCNVNNSDPYQLISLIQENSANPNIPIIELYSDASKCTRNDRGLCKPIKKSSLQAAVAESLQNRKQFSYNLRSSNSIQDIDPKKPKCSRRSKRPVRRLRVLVAEDNPDSRVVAIGYLNKIDPKIIIHTACNGQEAVEKVLRSSGAFDLILMDIRMPVMNGLDATKKIRDIVGKSPYIVAFTATLIEHETSANDNSNAYDMSLLDGYIGKPVMIQELQELIDIVRKRK